MCQDERHCRVEMRVSCLVTDIHCASPCDQQAYTDLEAREAAAGKELQDEIDSINVSRRHTQDVIGRQLYNMDLKRSELANKNLEIAIANESLRQDLKRFKTQ